MPEDPVFNLRGALEGGTSHTSPKCLEYTPQNAKPVALASLVINEPAQLSREARHSVAVHGQPNPSTNKEKNAHVYGYSPCFPKQVPFGHGAPHNPAAPLDDQGK